MPKISIVLPTFNGERWLAESITSIINQSEKDWELIIVNDCSTDGTLNIAENFSKLDHRIKIISNPTNKKLPASLNIGFNVAKGEYLTWTSDDNIYKSNALSKLVSYLETHPDVDMISMDAEFIDENNNFIKRFSDYFKYRRNAQYLMVACNVGPAFMYTRHIQSIVGKYDETKFCVEDYEYWCRIAINGKIDYVDDVIYQYRVHSNALTATKQDIIQRRTREVKCMYFKSIADKFNFSHLDRIKFYSTFPLSAVPIPDTIGALALRFYKVLMNAFVFIISRNKLTRKELRRKYSINKHFSFSTEK